MKSSAVSILEILVAAVLAALITFGCGVKDPDEQVLDRLKTKGVDLTKPHSVEFFLYFGEQKDAGKAADQIKALGFQIEIRPPGGSASNWLCYSTKTVVPELATLREIRRQLEPIAAAQGGLYDGWSIAAGP